MRRATLKQAVKMRERSKKFTPDCEIGEYVNVPVKDVDRGLTDPPNLLCRIVDYDEEHDEYELCCAAGCLTILFARSQFDRVVTESTFAVNLDRKIDSVREAVKLLSVGGGQGMLKCNCSGQCDSNRCSCKKNNLICNSRCHGGNTKCANKVLSGSNN